MIVLKDSPRISVIMSAYNCEKTIEESITSILHQSFQDFEFLIADDCSTDRTKALIETFADDRIILCHNTKNCHYLQTWNRLAALAKAPYITFQDADDISYPERLKTLHDKIVVNDDFAIVGANYYRPYDRWLQGTQSNYRLSYEEIKDDIDRNQIVNFYGTRSLFNKSIFIKVGGFRPFFDRMGWEDYDLFLRIAEQYKVCNVSDVLYEYRYYSTSSSKIKKSNISYKKVFIDEIGFYLHDQRKRGNGTDGLMEGGDQTEFQMYLKGVRQRYLQDESLAFRKMARNQISNKDYKNSFANAMMAINMKPFVVSNWALFSTWFSSYVRSCIKYLLIRLKVYKHEY